MRRLPILFLSLFITIPGYCETQVRGTIDGQTWTEAGAPCCMMGDLFISGLMI
jgi:hypothetical protein